MGQMSGETEGKIGASETSFRIIEHLRDEDGVGVSEVADAVGVSKSTAHNHLQTLRSMGYVVQEEGGYAVGLEFLSLGDHARQRYSLYPVVKENVDELVEAVGERAQVMVEENGRGVYLYQAKADKAVETDSHVGMTVKLHATAIGKAYLAFCDEAERDRVLQGQLGTKTPNTVTDRDELEAEFEQIREAGHAFNDEERILGMRAVGAPILTDTGEVLGALSVSGPTTRMNGDWYHEEVPEIVDQTARVVGIKATYP